MMKLHKLTFILLVIGGLNWLLVGIFSWDIGSLFGGQAAVISRVIYILVGLSALYEIFTHKSNCKMCGGMMMKDDMKMGMKDNMGMGMKDGMDMKKM